MTERKSPWRVTQWRVPLPIAGLMLACIGITLGDILIPAGHRLGSAPMRWLGLAAFIGGPLAGVAMFVYYLWNVRRSRT